MHLTGLRRSRETRRRAAFRPGPAIAAQAASTGRSRTAALLAAKLAIVAACALWLVPSCVSAQTIYVAGAFNGYIYGEYNGVDYVGPGGRCPTSGACSQTFLNSSATVTGQVV